MAQRSGRGTPRAGVFVSLSTIALLAACEVHGLVGSDLAASAGGSAEGGSESGGVEDDETGEPATTVTEPSDTSLDDGGETAGPRFDVPPPDAPESCNVPYALPCDGFSNDPFRAIGLNCEGGPQVTGSYRGHDTAMNVHHGKLGNSSAFPPREGERFVILSTGDASDLAKSPAELQAEDPSCVPLACPSTVHSSEVMALLPEPIDVRQVSKEGVDCTEDKSLVGTGDCSNTLFEQFVAGSGAADYAELRIDTVVPSGVDGFSYDFAFFSVEYPTWIDHASPFNDMYVAWLESENWTGNVSFDEFGHPISVTGVFLDYKDAPSNACPEPCNAPELAGFAMEGHAATKWLQTTAPVVQGEAISLLFAIFDLTDGSYDSMVALDHFEWTCSDAPPFTRPVG